MPPSALLDLPVKMLNEYPTLDALGRPHLPLAHDPRSPAELSVRLLAPQLILMGCGATLLTPGPHSWSLGQLVSIHYPQPPPPPRPRRRILRPFAHRTLPLPDQWYDMITFKISQITPPIASVGVLYDPRKGPCFTLSPTVKDADFKDVLSWLAWMTPPPYSWIIHP